MKSTSNVPLIDPIYWLNLLITLPVYKVLISYDSEGDINEYPNSLLYVGILPFLLLFGQYLEYHL